MIGQEKSKYALLWYHKDPIFPREQEVCKVFQMLMTLFQFWWMIQQFNLDHAMFQF